MSLIYRHKVAGVLLTACIAIFVFKRGYSSTAGDIMLGIQYVGD